VNFCGACLNVDPKTYQQRLEAKCLKGHTLKLEPYNTNGWACDGRNLPGGCKRGCTGFRQLVGVTRYRCKSCDYDLCDKCHTAVAFPEAESKTLVLGFDEDTSSSESDNEAILKKDEEDLKLFTQPFMYTAFTTFLGPYDSGRFQRAIGSEIPTWEDIRMIDLDDLSFVLDDPRDVKRIYRKMRVFVSNGQGFRPTSEHQLTYHTGGGRIA